MPQTRVVYFQEPDGTLPLLDYRILYFFHGNVAAVVSHGIVKARVVPPHEIDRAIRRKAQFLRNRNGTFTRNQDEKEARANQRCR